MGLGQWAQSVQVHRYCILASIVTIGWIFDVVFNTLSLLYTPFALYCSLLVFVAQ